MNQFQVNPTKKISLAEILASQSRERGFDPLPLDAELLLKRVAAGGHSGQFLADAFLSAYRPDIPFPHSLGQLIKLDGEAFRLFHGILHIRHTPDWDDNQLHQIEKKIITILRGGNSHD